MFEILKILRSANQKNCLDIVHTVIIHLAQDYTETSPEGPNVRDLQGTFKGLSGKEY